MFNIIFYSIIVILGILLSGDWISLNYFLGGLAIFGGLYALLTYKKK